MVEPLPFTLHQLRIFLAVAHSRSLTRAAKLLNQTQPSLSQHIARLEESIGQLLFERGREQFSLTDAGRFLFERAEPIMADIDGVVAGLESYAKGMRGVLSVGALSSIARNLIPPVQVAMAERFPDLEFDVHELAPGEAIELLYARRLTVAVVAAGSVASSGLSFAQTEVLSDPYVLAVPCGLQLGQIKDPLHQLDTAPLRVLQSAILFTFGTQHQLRIAEWYQRFIPGHRAIGRVRSYELALAMVQAGRGVAVVPSLSACIGPDRRYDVTLYECGLEPRRIVAMTPSQYRATEPQASFIAGLRDAAPMFALPPVETIPPFLRG